jgi:hypothetical protein
MHVNHFIIILMTLCIKHIQISVFFEKLKEFQIDTYVKIQSLHLVAKIHNKHVRNRQKFINNMIKRHNNKELTPNFKLL